MTEAEFRNAHSDIATILFNEGKPLDNAIEHEVEASEFGMTVFAQMTDGTMRLLQNVTEFHWRYETHWPCAMVAFESDVHGQGFTHPCSEYMLITMRKADKRHSQFQVGR